MDWFSTGMQEAFEHLSTYDGKRSSLFLPEFFLAEKERDVLIQIVGKEPHNCFVHSIAKVSKRGKPYSATKTCSHDEKCFYCEAAASGVKGVSKASWKAHLTVLDSRPWPYTKGDVAVEDLTPWTRRLWRASSQRITPLYQLRGIQKRGGLDGAYILVTRTGTETSTVYSYEYMSKLTLAKDKEFKDVIADLGWSPSEQKYAPCPEFDSASDVVQLDYAELLKPDSYEDAADFLSQSVTKKVKEEEEDEEAGEEYRRSVSRAKKKHSTT